MEFFFPLCHHCFIAIRLIYPEILERSHYHVFLVEVSLIEMLIEKDYREFFAAVSLFWGLFLLLCCYILQDVA